MKGYPEFESLDFLNELEPNAAVADMVYAAEGGETKLIQEARRLGTTYRNFPCEPVSLPGSSGEEAKNPPKRYRQLF